MPQPSRLLLAALLLAGTTVLHAQTPRVRLQFNGNLTDSSGAGLVTSVTANGGSPNYAADRNGTSNSAIVFNGGRSLTLETSSLPGDSNQALGLRNASGTNTSFTLCAWVMFTSLGSGQGYSTLFGNAGSGAGTLHAGLNANSSNTHFGFDGNDLNGGSATLVTNVWYHIAFTYDTTASDGQRIYINGIPDATRMGVTNTLKAANLLIGNHGSATDSSNDFKGRLDDVVIYNTALKGDQILALANGVSPASVPAVDTYFPPASTLGYRGTAGMWGIREIKNYSGISYDSMVNVDRILKAYASSPGGTKTDRWAAVINFIDDEWPGVLGYFGNEGDFATNTSGNDDNFLMFARCTVKIPTAGEYTFGFRGDDGARLRVVGQRFISSTRLSGGNADPAHLSDMLVYPNGTGDSNTLGVVNLAAGEYDLEFSYWEGLGSSAVEVFAAPGNKTAFDNTFQLIGNVAAGGLEIVRDSDTVPVFTVNGGPSAFVHNGTPSNFTLAWSVADPATTLRIDQGIGNVAQSGSLVQSSPASTKTYTITATTGLDVVTRTVTVYVNAAPVIASFTASDTTVPPGAAVTLSWNAQGATALTLNPGNINVTGTTSQVVNPASTTTYTLTATNAAGSTNSNVIVTTGDAPVISSFTVSEPSPMYGKETTLSWATTGGDSQSIQPSIGSVPASGSVIVVPLLNTTYTLTVVNAYGTSTADVATTVPTPVGVSSAGFTARRVSSTVPFPFAGQGYLQSAQSLLDGQNAGTTTNSGPYTTINFSDEADGDYTSDNVIFPGGSGDNFAVEITGTLVVNTPGEYTFMVNSDDGCRLRIDGVDVIVDDATHFPNTSSGRIVLTKPTVSFQLVHYDATGGASLEVSWVRPNQTWQQLSTATPSTPVVRGSLVLSELVASGSNLADEDGATQDWIEIWNSTNASIDLAGHFLTNSAATPDLWAFPSKVLAPNEYLVVFASSKNRVNPAANLHTTFNLPSGGGYLALTKSDGEGGFITLTEFNPFPAQTSGQSYGSSGLVPATGFMEVPTPAAPNAATYLGFVQPVAFSQARGRFTSAFNLTLSTTTPGATIRYTTDGSEPSWARGTIYTGPVSVSTTSTIRANAFLAGWKSPEPVTNTYLFLDDVVTQSTANTVAKGWPQSFVNGQVYLYDMNLTAVTNGGGDVSALKNALAAAPSVCLSLSPDDFHGVNNGIYSNPGKRGRFWEREASLEIIETNGATTTQKDCGVRIRGGFSRTTSNPKHAFHLYFRSLYAGDLIYPVFGNEGSVTRFDQIDMRCEQNNSWQIGGGSAHNSLMREQFARLSQRDMGQPYSRHGFFHLYINGIYWGVFNWQEKTEADYAANQFGGEDFDYDTVKSTGSTQGYNTEMTDGNELSWRLLFDLCLALKNAGSDATRNALYFQMQGLNPDGTRNLAYPIHLNADNLIDSQLAMFFDGSFDGPLSTGFGNASNNWFAVRRRDGSGGGWMFFLHDHEHSMGTEPSSYNRVGPWGDPNATSNNWGQTWTTAQYRSRETWVKFNPQYLHEFLCFSPEYRQRFSDRAHKHLTGTGALTQTAAIARADALVAQIDPIIHAEAARWGSSTLTKNTWLNTAKPGVYNFIDNGGTSPAGETSWSARARNLVVIEQLKGYTDNGAKSLFVNVSDPVVSGPQGGLVTAPHNFTITNPNGSGTIYYTFDGSDPRLIGGAVSGTVLTGSSPISLSLNASATLKARVFDNANSQWSGLVENIYLVAVPATAANTVISKIHYRPATGVTTGEFLEIMNIGTQDSVLTNCRFTVGITYTFPSNYVLPAGGRCVIVENQTAFAPAFSAAMVAGQFSGGLSNSGERLLFIDNLGATIKDFTYGVASPWPTAANGMGPCLVCCAETSPAHGTAANWRASTTHGGSPGIEDATRIAHWFSTNAIADTTGHGDKDHDGLEDLIEYALGTNAGTHNHDGLTVATSNISGTDYFTLTFTRPLGRDDAVYQAEASTGLTSWANAILVSATPNHTAGTETQVWRHPDPMSATGQQFMRLKVTRLP